MVQHARAVFKDGHLTPLTPLQGIPQHAIVSIAVELVTPLSVEERLNLLREVPVAPELADAIEAGRNQPWKL